MKVTVYEHAVDVPAFPEGSYFHSIALMELCERTPRHKPYMAVVTQDDGTIVAHMLTIVRYRHSWLPPYLYSHVRVMGDGEYHMEGIDRQEVFGMMAKAITSRFQWRVLYMEFSHMSDVEHMPIMIIANVSENSFVNIKLRFFAIRFLIVGERYT